ncbi:MAG: hypothetical protein JOZ25_03720, partial [Actinobacteria bacterium]|nr:hypothetical protein [Actinomycetota bacterium]
SVIGVFEVLAFPLVGLVAMVVSGKRRQRLGDLAAGTIVRRNDRPWQPAQMSHLVYIYPILWIGCAIFWGAQLDPKPVHLSSDPYMQQVDEICRTSRPLPGATPQQVEGEISQMVADVQALPAPQTATAKHGRSVVLKWWRRSDDALQQVLTDLRGGAESQTTRADAERLVVVTRNASLAARKLGLPDC